MQIKALILNLLAITSVCTGCNSLNSRHITLPECNIVYNAYEESFEQIISNERPNVVVMHKISNSKINNATLYDVTLLKKQIARYSNFDFIFYFVTEPENASAICEIAKENNLNIIAIVDSSGTFCEMNKIDKGIILIANIVDSKFRAYHSALPGISFSPFDETIQEFIRHNTVK